MLKRIGAEDEKAESQDLIRSIDRQIVELNPLDEADKRRTLAHRRDKPTIQRRIERANTLIAKVDPENRTVI